ncbi:hypothetical protein FACS189447_09560 [Spirochaetia bacterium]|nr:hypothetical protein FACS189447_09560 [Spirochaetia bacterium]
MLYVNDKPYDGKQKIMIDDSILEWGLLQAESKIANALAEAYGIKGVNPEYRHLISSSIRVQCIHDPYQLQCALEREGIDPDDVDSEGNTLIMQFIKQDKPLDLLKVIVKSNCALDVVNKDGLNALDIAVNQGHKDAVRLLVDQGLQHTKKWYE